MNLLNLTDLIGLSISATIVYFLINTLIQRYNKEIEELNK